MDVTNYRPESYSLHKNKTKTIKKATSVAKLR